MRRLEGSLGVFLVVTGCAAGPAPSPDGVVGTSAASVASAPSATAAASVASAAGATSATSAAPAVTLSATAGTPAAVVPSASAAGPGGCVDYHTARRADGRSTDCYPYRCRAGRCLKRCRAMADCAGTQRPGPLVEGWPLECMPSGECTPMPPWKVKGP